MKRRLQSANMYLFAYFIVLALFGSVIFQLPFLYKSGNAVPYIDGLFTTVSALCVTGLSTVDMNVYTNKGFCVLLFFIEAGGLGLVTFFTVYLAFPGKKISLINRNFIRDYFTGDAIVGARQILIRIMMVTLVIQACGAIVLSKLLLLAGEKHHIFYGIFLSVSAFCNAGFAPYSDSLHRFSSNYGICIIVCMLVIAGGLGFTVFSDIASRFHRKFRGKKTLALSLHTKIVLFMTILLITSGTILIFIADRQNSFHHMTLKNALFSAFFQSVTLRTAGFETVSQDSLTPASTVISMLLMIIGGNSGSMAGGLKTTTVFVICCFAFKREGDRGNMSVFHRDISSDVLDKTIGIVIKAFCYLLAALFLLCITEHNALQSGIFSLSDLVYETISAFGTVGVSKGVTSALSVLGKLIIIVSMFAGRTGIVALVLSVSLGGKQKTVTDYPCEDVLVG